MGIKMLQVHALVSGFVQGVNFRYYTVRRGKQLGLNGFVRNTVDGRVEVVAQGSMQQLERMIEWLRNGPSSASVENVKVEWHKSGKKFSGFKIKY